MDNKIGIIGAMDVEIAILLKIMEENNSINKKQLGNLIFYSGKIFNNDVVVVKSGIGKVNAALCAYQLIYEFKVSKIINTGIAGAIAKDLGIFDMVVSTDAVYHDFDTVAFGYKPTVIPQMKESAFKADEKLIEIAQKSFLNINNEKNIKMIKGRIATGDQFISNKEVKNKIIEVCNPSCVEMEGCGIAHACYLANVPFLILRCMSDMADDNHEKVYDFNEKDAAEQSANVLIEMLKIGM